MTKKRVSLAEIRFFFARIQGKPQDLPSDPEKWADMPFFRPPDHAFSISFFVL
jgi:hypothetical protein